jgi:nicotinate-nucleotide adenylyltransferase
MARCGVDDVSKPERLGLFGGTFDPVHNGHLAVAGRVQEAFGLDSIWFIPAPVPPHKPGHIDNRDISSFAHRAEMLALALGDLDDFTLSRIEDELPKPSYTIDTLQEIRRRLGSEVQLYFIIGVDAFVEIATWKDFLQLPALANFVVISRPAYQFSEVEAVMNKYFTRYSRHSKECSWLPEDGKGGKMYFLNMEPVAVSSTEIRRMVHDGHPIQNLVPPGVKEYILEHRLYGDTA